MNSSGAGFAGRAANLRHAFDRAFTEAPQPIDLHSEDFLAIRLGADPYAIRLAEISGVFADRRVSPLPSSLRELLGITAFRGAILPVYDLRLMLGYSPASAPRWLVVAAHRPVALAFDAVDGHLRLAPNAIAQNGTAHRGQAQALEIARAAVDRPILRLGSIVEAVERKTREIHLKKEH